MKMSLSVEGEMMFKGAFQHKAFHDSMGKGISLDRSLLSFHWLLSGWCWETDGSASQVFEQVCINIPDYKQDSGEKKGMQSFLE